MKSLSMKVIRVSVLLIFLSISSYCQTAAFTKPVVKSYAKLDKTKVPKTVSENFSIDYPATDYNYWYGYPTFDYSNDWYGYDPYFYNNNYPAAYVVEFAKNKTPYKAVYTSAGKKVAIHKSISSVPAAISAAIDKSIYKTWKVGNEKEEIFKDSDKDQLKVYKVSVTIGTEKHALYYQPDGKLLKDTKVS